MSNRARRSGSTVLETAGVNPPETAGVNLQVGCTYLTRSGLQVLIEEDKQGEYKEYPMVGTFLDAPWDIKQDCWELDGEYDKTVRDDPLDIVSQLPTPTAAPGATKFDADKPAMNLLDTHALGQLANVLGFGARKYDAHNWRKGMKWSRLQASLLRHVLAFQGGEDLDPETGLPHLAHAMCNCMFLVNYMETHRELDDRPGSSECVS